MSRNGSSPLNQSNATGDLDSITQSLQTLNLALAGSAPPPKSAQNQSSQNQSSDRFGDLFFEKLKSDLTHPISIFFTDEKLTAEIKAIASAAYAEEVRKVSQVLIEETARRTAAIAAKETIDSCMECLIKPAIDKTIDTVYDGFITMSMAGSDMDPVKKLIMSHAASKGIGFEATKSSNTSNIVRANSAPVQPVTVSPTTSTSTSSTESSQAIIFRKSTKSFDYILYRSVDVYPSRDYKPETQTFATLSPYSDYNTIMAVASSGYDDILGGQLRIKAASARQSVFRLAKDLSYYLAPTSFDRTNESGSFNACHAEKQLIAWLYDEYFGTNSKVKNFGTVWDVRASREPCDDCLAFVKAFNEKTGFNVLLAHVKHEKIEL